MIASIAPRVFLGLAAALAGAACLQPAEAALLSHIDFSGGTVGQTLAANSSLNGFGTVANFDGFTNAANIEYVAGLSGSLGSTGNAIALNNGSARVRMIIDRTTPEWSASGLIGGDTLIGSGSIAGSLYGSVLIKNDAAASGFTGLEFANGNPNSNRVITLGEAQLNTPSDDFVVLGSGQAGGATDLALPAIVAGATREIVFRIDYTAGGDTFTLINPDGTDGASGTGSFQFATLHLAAFSGSPTVVYDEIRLGTELADVTAVVPEPVSAALVATATLLGFASRRRRG